MEINDIIFQIRKERDKPLADMREYIQFLIKGI